MTTRIGIIGAGTAGLHLGLRLQQLGIPSTIYTERDPAELRSARLPNTVCHHAPTRERERLLGVNHWDTPELVQFDAGFTVNGPQGFTFSGKLVIPSQFVDYRVYQPRLAEDFVARGGQLHVSQMDEARLEELTQRHEQVVVATGRGGLSHLFPRMPEHSPYSQPKRLLFGGLFHGMRPPEPLRFQFNICPGHGEIVEGRMVSVQGFLGSLFIAATPGGALEVLATRNPNEDPRGFAALLLELLREHAPITFERLDPASFQLAGPLDWLQGRVTPVARRGYAQLKNGRCVLALGDAHVLHDPVAGQGANGASACAWTLAETLHEAMESGAPLDEAFCRRAAERTWDTVRATTYWSNALLEPPAPHMAQLLFIASQNPAFAQAILDTMMFPDTAVATFGSPEGCAAFLKRHAHLISA